MKYVQSSYATSFNPESYNIPPLTPSPSPLTPPPPPPKKKKKRIPRSLKDPQKIVSFENDPQNAFYQASILRKSTSGRHLPVGYPDGPMTARYRFT